LSCCANGGCFRVVVRAGCDSKCEVLTMKPPHSIGSVDRLMARRFWLPKMWEGRGCWTKPIWRGDLADQTVLTPPVLSLITLRPKVCCRHRWRDVWRRRGNACCWVRGLGESATGSNVAALGTLDGLHPEDTTLIVKNLIDAGSYNWIVPVKLPGYPGRRRVCTPMANDEVDYRDVGEGLEDLPVGNSPLANHELGFVRPAKTTGTWTWTAPTRLVGTPVARMKYIRTGPVRP